MFNQMQDLKSLAQKGVKPMAEKLFIDPQKLSHELLREDFEKFKREIVGSVLTLEENQQKFYCNMMALIEILKEKKLITADEINKKASEFMRTIKEQIEKERKEVKQGFFKKVLTKLH